MAQYNYLNAILSAYHSILSPSSFLSWLTHRNLEDSTIFEMSINLPIFYSLYVSIIDLLFSFASTDLKIFHSLLIDRKSNLFHQCARYGKYYPLLLYYENIYKLFPSTNPLNIKSLSGLTPLHYACFFSHKRMADILLELGSDINARDKSQETPLHYAVACGNYPLVKKLIIYGADKEAKNIKGMKPCDIAKKYNYSGILEMLEKGMCNFKEIETIRNKERDGFLLFMYCILEGIKILCILKGNGDLKDYGIIASICVDVVVICFIWVFRLYGDKWYIIKKREKNEKVSKLIREGDYECNEVDHLCVVCKLIKREETKHCIICGICVDEWDHHCFWLNKCINKKNKKYFLEFIIILHISIGMTLIQCVLIFMDIVVKDGRNCVIVKIIESFTNSKGSLIKYIVMVLDLLFICYLAFCWIMVLLQEIFEIKRWCKTNVKGKGEEQLIIKAYNDFI